MSGKCRADRGPDRRDFVLSLERLDAEVLVFRKLVQYSRSRSDRIAAIEQRPAGELRGRDESDRRRFVSGDISVFSRSDLRFADVVMGGEDLGRVGIVITCLERQKIRL